MVFFLLFEVEYSLHNLVVDGFDVAQLPSCEQQIISSNFLQFVIAGQSKII